MADVVETCADLGSIGAAVGFSPSTPLEGGVSRFAAWFADFHAGDFAGDFSRDPVGNPVDAPGARP